MPLAHRIIPTILVRGRQLVKGIAFDSWRSVGIATQAARIHSMRGVDELVILDISATREGRGPDLGMIEELSETCFMPLAVGGGVRGIDDAQALLRAGADKVVVGSGGPEVIHQITKRVGQQAVVASVDYKGSFDEGALPRAYTHNGTRDVDSLPGRLFEVGLAGAGEILLTAIELEGTMRGYDICPIYASSRTINVPLIASGGCGEYRHMLEAIQAGANAVAAGAMFQFTDYTPRGAAEYLHVAGVEVRL